MRCKGVYCVDLGERFRTNIWLQSSASIQRRTSPAKFARSPCTDYYYYYRFPRYTLPRSLLEFEDSYLGALFRGEDITLETDAENYLVLDVDPDCWKILVQFPRLFSGRDWGFGVGRLIKFWRARSRLYRRLR